MRQYSTVGAARQLFQSSEDSRDCRLVLLIIWLQLLAARQAKRERDKAKPILTTRASSVLSCRCQSRVRNKDRYFILF